MANNVSYSLTPFNNRKLPYNVENPFSNENLSPELIRILDIFERDEILKLVFEYGPQFDNYLEKNKISLLDPNPDKNLRLELIQLGITNNIISTEKDSLNKLLFAASYYGNVQTVQYLIEEKDADINATSYTKSTALMFAAQMGNLETMQYLINKSADINAKDNYGKTALMYAREAGLSETIIISIKST